MGAFDKGSVTWQAAYIEVRGCQADRSKVGAKATRRYNGTSSKEFEVVEKAGHHSTYKRKEERNRLLGTLKKSVHLKAPDVELLVCGVTSGIHLAKKHNDSIDHTESLISDVLNSITSDDRKRIQSHWLEHPVAPLVLFEEPWMADGEVFGRTESLGHRINFEWLTFRLLPDAVAKSLLAHELAHVFQHAIGKTRDKLKEEDFEGEILPKDFIRNLGPVGRVELHADETMTRWGFDRLATQEWEHRLIQMDIDGNWKKDIDGKPIMRKKPLSDRTARSRAKDGRNDVYQHDIRVG